MSQLIYFLAGGLVTYLLLTVVAPRVSWLRQRLIYDELADVRDMHRKFGFLDYNYPGHATRRLLRDRAVMLQEELDEFNEAADRQDLADQADALIDLVYLAKGTARILGLPWEQLWADVHRANMAKRRGVGKRGMAVDLMKPDGWEPPNTAAILYMAGYYPDDWRYAPDTFGGAAESLCRDYPAYLHADDAQFKLYI